MQKLNLMKTNPWKLLLRKKWAENEFYVEGDNNYPSKTKQIKTNSILSRIGKKIDESSARD